MAPGPHLGSPLAFINKILLVHNQAPGCKSWGLGKGVSEKEN